MSLDELRDELTSLDGRLLELVAERQRIVGKIGRKKLVTGRATRDFEREKVVLETAREQAKSLSLDPKLAEGILRSLIHASLTSQVRERVAAEGKGNGRSVLVIGGAGKMGGWFVDFFASQGYTTSIAESRATASDGSFLAWVDAAVAHDAVVVATPLVVSGRILAQLAARRPPGLVFDIGSLKTPLRAGLEALADAGWSVTS